MTKTTKIVLAVAAVATVAYFVRKKMKAKKTETVTVKK